MKLLLRLTVLIFLVVAWSLEMVAQVPTGDSIDYYPYRAGDFWGLHSTTVADFPPDVYIVEQDSTDTLGNRFLFLQQSPYQIISGRMMIDTSGDVYADVGTDSVQLLYRTRAGVGEQWIVRQTPTRTVYAICSAISPKTFVIWPTMLKEFQYWSTSGSGDSVWEATRVLASSFGEYYQCFDSSDWNRWYYASTYLTGVWLRGQMYGYISAVENRVSQNALRMTPNPFNAGVVLTYQLDSRQHVLLTLTDALGRIVATPVDEVQNAGEHSTSIDGSILPTGTYFYHLRTPSLAASGTLIRY